MTDTEHARLHQALAEVYTLARACARLLIHDSTALRREALDAAKLLDRDGSSWIGRHPDEFDGMVRREARQMRGAAA